MANDMHRWHSKLDWILDHSCNSYKYWYIKVEFKKLVIYFFKIVMSKNLVFQKTRMVAKVCSEERPHYEKLMKDKS